MQICEISSSRQQQEEEEEAEEKNEQPVASQSKHVCNTHKSVYPIKCNKFLYKKSNERVGSEQGAGEKKEQP